jgi:AraC-like DNA-binding protein
MESDIYPIQPFLMTNTTKYYKMKMPHSPIVHFYAFNTDALLQRSITAVPDGCVDLLFEVSQTQVNGQIYGTVTKNYALQVRGGCTYFGVRFMPGYLPKKFSVSLPELVDNHISLQEIQGGSLLVESIAEAADFQSKIAVVKKFIDDSFYQSDLLHMLISNIGRYNGNVRVSALEKETHYTARYLNKVFQQQLGIPPKAFANIIRFQTMLQKMNANRSFVTADLAAEFGYFDQSHLIKEFKEFAALTPGEYVTAVDLPKYGKQIILVDQ